MNKQNLVEFKHGHPLGNKGYLMAVTFIFFGVAIGSQGETVSVIFAFFLIFVGVFVGSAKCGLIVNKSDNTYLVYESYLFFKKGKWKDLTPFSDLCLLTKRYSSKIYSRSSYSTDMEFSQKEVYLMDKNHIRRILVEVIASNKPTNNRIKEIEKLLNREFVKFNPQLAKGNKRK